MKILILGAGQVGRTAAYHFSREEANEVTVVDSNEEVLRELQDRLDIRGVAGNASYPSVLEAAGAAEADILVALTSSDEVNMMACEVAHNLFRTPTKIARIRSQEYTSQRDLFSEEAIPVDFFFSPEQLVTDYIEQLIRYPGALQVLDFADGKVQLVGVRAASGGGMTGQQLRELPQHIAPAHARIVAIYRNGRTLQADGTTIITEGDEIFFLAARSDIRRVMGQLRREEGPVRRVLIAGGGNIGLRLARALEQTSQVKVIERNAVRARKIAEHLEKAIVLGGDSTDDELLIEENIDSIDVFVAVTNSEEANIVSAMLAKRLGAHKAMALINKPYYTDLVETGGIDVAISPQTVTLGTLIAQMRRGDVRRVHTVRRGAAEALEAIVHGDERTSRIVGRVVMEIPLPEGTRIGAVVRGEEVMMAHHDTRLCADDHVILFLSDRRHLEAVERLFLRTAL
jgi:trk system potassium uptake protein TrkA